MITTPGEQTRAALSELYGAPVHYYAERGIKPLNVAATIIDVTPEPRVNWERVVMWVAVAGFALAILCGCERREREANPPNSTQELQVAVDMETGTRCYRFRNQGGISCVRP